MGLQIRDLTDEETRLAEEIRTLGERRAVLGAEREGKLTGLAEGRQRHSAQEARMREIEGELDACRDMLAERRQRFEDLREERISVAGARADLTRSSGELRERGVHLDGGASGWKRDRGGPERGGPLPRRARGWRQRAGRPGRSCPC